MALLLECCSSQGHCKMFAAMLRSQWGAVERGPGQYLWTGYKQLLEAIRQTGLKLQVGWSKSRVRRSRARSRGIHGKV